MSQPSPQASSGLPKVLRYAVFGGVPNRKIDVPASAVMIALFTILGFLHMKIFKANQARNRFFVFSAVTFGFCMSRITTFSVRIASAKNPENVGLSIAAQVLLSAGVLLLYVINFLFAQRILAALHPTFARKTFTRFVTIGYCFALLPVLIMTIVASVKFFFTSDPSKLKQYSEIRKFATVWFTVFAFAPIPELIIAKFIPSKTGPKPFGTGSITTQIAIVLTAAFLLTFSIALRVSTMFLRPKPASVPVWYQSKVAFYITLPVLEILVVLLYAITRVDQRFYLPGKAEQKAKQQEQGAQVEDNTSGTPNKETGIDS